MDMRSAGRRARAQHFRRIMTVPVGVGAVTIVGRAPDDERQPVAVTCKGLADLDRCSQCGKRDFVMPVTTSCTRQGDKQVS